MVTLNPHADPVDDLRACEAAIVAAGWFARSGLPERWPLSSDDMLRMLAAAEYEIDEQQLADLIARRLIRPPTLEGDSPEWSAADVIAVSGLLEARGQWSATPSIHDPKKTEAQLLLERTRQDGTVDQIGDAPGRPRFDLPHILALLASAPSAPMRQMLVCHLKAALEVEHGVFIP